MIFTNIIGGHVYATSVDSTGRYFRSRLPLPCRDCDDEYVGPIEDKATADVMRKVEAAKQESSDGAQSTNS